MKLIRNVLAGGLLAGAAVLAACSGQTSPTGSANGGNNVGTTGPGTGAVASLGNVGVDLVIGNGTGQSLTSVNWTISGGPGGTYPPDGPGTDTIGQAQSVEWVAGGILAGCGYVLSVTGTDSAGDPCVGTSASFCVVAGASTSVTLPIVCTVPTDAATQAQVDTGSVAVDASVTLVNQGAFACPGISSFSISPAEVVGAATASLSIATTGNSAGTIVWSDTSTCTSGSVGGFLGPDGGADTSTPNVVFSCGNCQGTATVTAQVQLDVVPLGGTTVQNVCNGVQFTTFTGNIVCEGGGGLVCVGGTTACPLSDGGSVCDNLQTDVNNCGACANVCASGDTCVGGVCKPPAPTACTTAPCSANGANSVQCPASPTGNGVCTATEAAIVNNIDIPQGHLTAAGQLIAFSATTSTATQGSCYTCLNNKSCLDDNAGDTGLECGDAPALPLADGGIGGAPGTGSTLCLNTLDCIVQSDCQGAAGVAGTADATGVVNCYCGSNFPGNACQTAGTGTDGLCVNQEAAGFGFAFSDNKDILGNFAGDGLFASAFANEIFSCAVSNKCSICAP